MTDLSFGEGGNTSNIDAGALMLCGGYVKSINLKVGWGQSSTTCDVEIISEVDFYENDSFEEPKIGSLLSVCIKNEKDLGVNGTFRFIGIVASIDKKEGSGGRIKTIRLTDTKDILKNIPVYLNRVSDVAENKFDEINNIVYAYKDGYWDEDDKIPYRNKKGLVIESIKEAVEKKTFAYFLKNTASPQLGQYEIDLSSIFDKREIPDFVGRYMSDDSVFDSIDEGLTGKKTQKVTISYKDQDQLVCQKNYRISGESASLLEIIDRAMKDNGCDWYVYTYQKSNPTSTATEKINSTVVIKIMPVPRNETDVLDQSEFNDFIAEFEDYNQDNSIGKELANETTNKIIFGSPFEYYEKASASGFNQFWGFKRPEKGVEQVKTVTDRYGNEFQVKSAGINEHPTFDTSNISSISIENTLISDDDLRAFIQSHLGFYHYNPDGDLSSTGRDDLIKYFSLATTLNNTYELNTDTEIGKYEMILLEKFGRDIDSFTSLLESIYNYVDWYYSNSNNYSTGGIRYHPSSESYIKSNGIGNVSFCGKSYQAGSFLVVPHDFTDNIRLSFTHQIEEGYRGNFNGSLEDYSITGFNEYYPPKDKGSIRIYYDNISDPIYKYVLTTKEDFRNGVIGINISNILKHRTKEESEKNIRESKRQSLDYGWHCITIEVDWFSIYEKDNGEKFGVPQTDYVKIWIQYFPKQENSKGKLVTINPYEQMRDGVLYKWAIASMVKFVSKVNKGGDNVIKRTVEKALTNFGSTEKGQRSKVILSNYAGFSYEKLWKRYETLFNIVSSYLNEYSGKQFYAYYDRDAPWMITEEAWDGEGGDILPNRYVRGKFINKENGKMPCVAEVEDASTLLTINGDDTNSVFIYNDDNEGDLNSAFFRADISQFALGKPEEDGGVEETIAVIKTNISLKKEPNKEGAKVLGAEKFTDINTQSAGFAFVNTYNTMVEYSQGVLHDGSKSFSTLPYEDLIIAADYFYIPEVSRYVRYGPWILDYRNGVSAISNRSNYGKTEFVADQDLNPWTFKSYDKAAEYVLDQHKNAVSTLYELSRGQVTVADIPRYNYGYRIGKYANVTNLSINYSAGGVSTTYTMTTFGAGLRTRERKEREHIIERLRNVEDNFGGHFNILNKEEVEDIVKRGKVF